MSRYTQKSFSGGVLSSSLYSRNDLAKYAIGLKTLKNGFVRAEGCVSNRAGLELVCEVKDSNKKVKLIPFSFNTEQTYVIELGEGYSRFIKEGSQIIYPEDSDKAGEIVELEMPYSVEEIFEIKYAQNADVLTICNKNHSPSELSRLSHYEWKLTPINFEPLITAPTKTAPGSDINGVPASDTKAIDLPSFK